MSSLTHVRQRPPLFLVNRAARLCVRAQSARELGSESQEPFERFFDRLFRHHAGQMSPSEGAVAGQRCFMSILSLFLADCAAYSSRNECQRSASL